MNDTQKLNNLLERTETFCYGLNIEQLKEFDWIVDNARKLDEDDYIYEFVYVAGMAYSYREEQQAIEQEENINININNKL